MDAKYFGQALVQGDPTSLVDVLSIPTVCEVVLRHLGSVTALRQSCSAVCALVRRLTEQTKKKFAKPSLNSIWI
jgi:hypothetical protein